MPTSPDFLALQQLLAGRYSIERELGRGGMGIVLLARDVALDRLVAIKLLPSHLAASAESRQRFLREARTAAGLSHPNIVPIHIVEERGELVFFVMGFVDGGTLRERVEQQGPLPPRLALKILQEVAWALAYAHQRGVIHRDVKPDNILIERATDRALVTDFGIALGRNDVSDGEGVVIGTARYMSPEQAYGEPVDARSDLYCLGATFFYALTGRAPFEGKNLPAILAQQERSAAPGILTLRPEVPPKLAAIIDGCLERTPERRPQTGDDVARLADEARGRDFRAPPMVRNFIRNAQVSTMVLLAVALAGKGTVVGGGPGASISVSGSGLIGGILLVQLILVARRLLRNGYSFADIRTALLAEAQVQLEEADAVQQGKYFRRLDRLWLRIWAGRVGRWFFSLAGWGIHASERAMLPSADATEMVLGRSTMAAYGSLTERDRAQAREVPGLVDRLERDAEELRARGDTGERLTQKVAALENLRLAMLRLQSGTGTLEDLTGIIERAKAVGEYVDQRLDAQTP